VNSAVPADPYGCRYCNEPVTEHSTRYHHRIGLHQWQGRTPEQIETRTRRAARAIKEN
jgi:hypothetical protein